MALVRLRNVLFDVDDFAHAESCNGLMASGMVKLWLKSRAGVDGREDKPYVVVSEKLYEIEEAIQKAKLESRQIPAQ